MLVVVCRCLSLCVVCSLLFYGCCLLFDCYVLCAVMVAVVCLLFGF